jgi:hypothetical protein
MVRIVFWSWLGAGLMMTPTTPSAMRWLMVAAGETDQVSACAVTPKLVSTRIGLPVI